jgi:hypothetical protein
MQTDFRRALARLVPVFMLELLFRQCRRVAPWKAPSHGTGAETPTGVWQAPSMAV